MNFLIAVALFVVTPGAATEPGQNFTLKGGDYRWVSMPVKRIPSVIECSFTVEGRQPTVHAELLSLRDFIGFIRHHDYDSLATTPSSAASGFRRMISWPGEYRVLIMNDAGAPPVAVTMIVRMNVDPEPTSVSTGISGPRQLGVIALSLTLFFATAFWSGRKLLRAWRTRPFTQ